MNRRFFLKNTMTVSVMSSLMMSAFLKSFFLRSAPAPQRSGGKILVLIQLDGGNDGLNTVIPIDQYENLLKARKNILIPEKKILALNGTAITGLHPALSGLQDLYNNKQLSIIQGVGITNPDLSHFKAIDIWHTGSDSAEAVDTGWLGRYFDQLHSIHRHSTGHPPAIQVGASLSKALQGQNNSIGMVVGNTDALYDIAIGQYDKAPASMASAQLSFLRDTAIQSKEYLQTVKEAVALESKASTLYPKPGSNPLADQLKTVAQLIRGGMQTQVYITSLRGFDTHSRQVDSSDTTQGDHADLLSQLSAAIAAFEDDLHIMGRQDDVLGMTYSEFGRRIRSNASYGCDHGTSAPLLLFGTGLKGGLLGTNPHISDQISVNDNVPLQTDFRSVYTSVLEGWFGVPKNTIDPMLPGGYASLDLFKA